jgi:protein-S-isoprenylcysteine O-methyltransferase Ste14
MNRYLTIGNGAVCYVVSLAAFLYAIGFVGNLVVPRSIDNGHLLLAVAITGYILIALQLEDHDLNAALGEQYRDHRGRAPMFIPGLHRRGDHAAPGTTPRPA